jgi:hypothetical protein
MVYRVQEINAGNGWSLELKAQGRVHWHPEGERDHPINFFDHYVENFDLRSISKTLPHISDKSEQLAHLWLLQNSLQIHILENMPYLNTMGSFEANVTHDQFGIMLIKYVKSYSR